MAKSEYIPQTVLHPSVTLNEKLDEMGMSRKEFAMRTGKPEQTIIAVLKGESSITPEMAILFENVTRIPASFWVNKQARYNEFKAREKQRETIIEAADWTKLFPYAEMAKFGWVPPTRCTEEKTVNLFSYFAISSNFAWDNLYMKSELKVAAYTTLKSTNDPHAISAWLRRGEIQAAEIETPDFNPKLFKKNLSHIKTLMANQPDGFFASLQKLCLEAGVKILYTPRLPKAPLSGSTRWINDNPIIQMTARYNQNDRFWFTFFHEAGHILLHGKKYISLENINFSESDPMKEQEAHKFAEEWTFSEEQENEVLSTSPLTEDDIISYAEKFNTHPAIIIGRFHHKGLLPFSVGRKFIIPLNLSD
jgi:plasmid maintenance system antidote protein VapI/Zn-dependent peptidase ImmA (M78 family)